MSDLASFFALLAGVIAGVVAAVSRLRRQTRRDTINDLKAKEVAHAQDIAKAVAQGRADRRPSDHANLPDRVHPPDHLADRGWRD